MDGICITHSCIPLYTVYMQHIMAHSGGMQEWVIQIPPPPPPPQCTCIVHISPGTIRSIINLCQGVKIDISRGEEVIIKGQVVIIDAGGEEKE